MLLKSTWKKAWTSFIPYSYSRIICVLGKMLIFRSNRVTCTHLHLQAICQCHSRYQIWLAETGSWPWLAKLTKATRSLFPGFISRVLMSPEPTFTRLSNSPYSMSFTIQHVWLIGKQWWLIETNILNTHHWLTQAQWSWGYNVFTPYGTGRFAGLISANHGYTVVRSMYVGMWAVDRWQLRGPESIGWNG